MKKEKSHLIENPIGTLTAFRTTIQEILHLITHTDASVAINDGLSKVMSFFDSDRVFIGFLNKTDSSLSFLHEIFATGKTSLNDFLHNQFQDSPVLYEKHFPWWIDNVKKGIDTVISNIEDWPEEARNEQSVLIKNGLISTLTTPIYAEGEIKGFMGVEFYREQHTWTESEIENIHFFADLFSVLTKNEQMQKTINDSSAEIFKSHAFFKTIFDKLPVGIEVYDENGYMIDVNPYDLKILGAQKENLLGINFFENPVISKEDLDRIRSGKETTFENDYHCNIINEEDYFQTSHVDKVLRLIGKCVPLKDKDNKIFSYVNLVHHHTSYYEEKEMLHDSLEKLKMAINSANSYIWEYDVKDNSVNIDYSLLDYKQNQIIQTDKKISHTSKESHLDRIHPEDKKRIVDRTNQIISGEILSFTDTYRQYLDGELNWYTTFFRVYKYEDNKPSSIICLTRNITQQRENELALIKEKETYKAKTALINNMSHELRTPLNAIVGFSNILAETNNTEENSFFIDVIQKNNNILLQIIDSVLSFTKIESGALEYIIDHVDIKDICWEAISLKSFNKKDYIQFHFDENLPSIFTRTDKDRIVQVLFHLLDNAYKFVEEGSVTLNYYVHNEKEVRIEITDTGIGMTEDEISQMYNTFYKADEFQVGLGLGLSISKKMVEDLGGSVGVSSKKGEGTTFWFHLPLVAD